MCDGHYLAGGGFAARRNFHWRCLLPDLFARGIEHPHRQAGVAGFVGIVADRRLNRDHSLAQAYLQGGHIGAPMRDMHRTGRDQPDVAIDPASRVPPARLLEIIDTNGDDVVAIRARPKSDVALNADVAVFVVPNLLSIHPHIRAIEDAIELQQQSLAGELRRKAERLAIPADPDRRKAAGAARGIVRLPRTFDAPVMRHIESAP